jgi:large subunit ribosomal protein L22
MTKQLAKEQYALAKATNLPVSTKQCVEISRSLRYKTTTAAKKFLEEVVTMQRPVAFKKFNRDMGHKAGMAAGRYPQKAAHEFLHLIKSVEANAQVKGLSSSLKITKLLANKANTPLTGGRRRRGTKRTHLEVEVCEVQGKKTKIDEKKSLQKPVEVKKEKPQTVSQEHPKEVKKEEVQPSPVETFVESEVPAEVEAVVTPEATPEAPVSVEKVQSEPVQKTELVKKEPAEEKVVPAPEVEKKPEPALETPQPEEKIVERPKEEAKEVPTKAAPLPPVVEKIAKQTEKQALVESTTIQKPVVQDLSSAELLAKAQEKAAELNKKETKDKSVTDVENLYHQLQKKGSLRDKK